MSLGTPGILHAIGVRGSPSAFSGRCLFLFAISGAGNASTFPMIPASMRKEAAAIIGFASAVAACGAVFIPKSFGSSIAATGGAELALHGFLGLYLRRIAMTWWFHTRRGGLLYEVERGKAAPAPAE